MSNSKHHSFDPRLKLIIIPVTTINIFMMTLCAQLLISGHSWVHVVNMTIIRVTKQDKSAYTHDSQVIRQWACCGPQWLNLTVRSIWSCVYTVVYLWLTQWAIHRALTSQYPWKHCGDVLKSKNSRCAVFPHLCQITPSSHFWDKWNAAWPSLTMGDVMAVTSIFYIQSVPPLR